MGVSYSTPYFIQPLDEARITGAVKRFQAAAARHAQNRALLDDPMVLLQRYRRQLDAIDAWMWNQRVRCRLAWRCAGCGKVRRLEEGCIIRNIASGKPDNWDRYCLSDECKRKAS